MHFNREKSESDRPFLRIIRDEMLSIHYNNSTKKKEIYTINGEAGITAQFFLSIYGFMPNHIAIKALESHIFPIVVLSMVKQLYLPSFSSGSAKSLKDRN